jgi:predicted membrane protein
VRKKELDQECYELMARWLWGFMIIAVILELMEVLSIAYERTERWAVLEKLISGELNFSYVYMQIIVFSLIPFVLLTITSIFRFNYRWKNVLIWISSGMLLIQVLLMRWNVVIGGQLVSKSMRGFTEYFPGIFDKEGLIVSAVIILIPFVLLWLFDSIFPFFHKKKVRRIFFSEYE